MNTKVVMRNGKYCRVDRDTNEVLASGDTINEMELNFKKLWPIKKQMEYIKNKGRLRTT